jgi:hypothetical protein
MLALSWPFGFPVRLADSGGDANSLRSNSAPPSFRSQLHGSATPKVKYSIFINDHSVSPCYQLLIICSLIPYAIAPGRKRLSDGVSMSILFGEKPEGISVTTTDILQTRSHHPTCRESWSAQRARVWGRGPRGGWPHQ